MWWQYGVGYLFSVVVGHFLVYKLIEALWMNLGWKAGGEKDALRPVPEHPAMVGLLERALYTSAWQLGKPEFIGLWLAVKVVGNWKGWSVDAEPGGRRLSGRSIFNLFLIGNGFSIAYGVVGALLIKWLKYEEFDTAFITGLILVAGTAGFWLWSRQLRAGQEPAA
jgi:hypothetical protein